MNIWVCGEVLIDLIPDSSGERIAHVGGGPANTAKALARLGHDVYFIDGISSDKYGQMSRQELLDDDVKLDSTFIKYLTMLRNMYNWEK